MTRSAYTPRPYQELITSQVLCTPRVNVWAGMGLGKTVSVLTALDLLYRFGLETKPTLVIAPLRVARSVWPDESLKWDHLSGLEVVPVIGEVRNRESMLKRDAPVFAINYENVPWLLHAFEGKPWPFGIVIADEATRLKSTRVSIQKKKTGGAYVRSSSGGSARGAELAKIAFRGVHRWINLTGTPAPNGLRDLWGQQWFIDGGRRLGRSFTAFQSRWFMQEPGDRGYLATKPASHADAEIRAVLKDCTISLEAADWFDLKEPIIRTIYVDLPPAARKLYRDMEKKLFMELDGDPVEAMTAAAKTVKCLQIANGAAYVDEEGNWKEIHDAKLEALKEVFEEAGGSPVLVAYHFRSDLVRLMRAFPQGRVLDQDPKTLRDWNAGRVSVLFAHPASAGHGLNLQDGGNIIVFFGHWWNLEEYQQIIERIGPVRQMQAGHNRAVFVYHIVARDTIDEDVMLRRESKREVQSILMDAMKRRSV